MSPSEGSAGLLVGEASAQAVLLDPRNRLRARARVAPVADGLAATCAAALDALAEDLGRPLPAATRVTLGTHAITDALAARRELARVAVVRVGGPLTGAVPPLWTWPRDLRAAVVAGDAIVAGGAEYDGRRPTPLDVDAVRRFLDGVRGTVDAVAVVGVFAPISAEDELRVAEVVRHELGHGVAVSLSHEIGSLGLLERENATALNAALVGPARALATMLTSVLEERGVTAEPYVTQSDGSAMTLDFAEQYAVLMVGSGPALALRGAAFLSGITECVVVDDDGGQTDIGVLVSGVPREGPDVTELAGVRTTVRRPQIVRRARDAHSGEPRVGGIRAPATVVAVGDGAAAVEQALAGREGIEVTVPPEADVAGAIGAAVTFSHGQVERICEAGDERTRREAIAGARRTAVERAIHAGADPALVQVVEVEQRPLSYLVTPALWIRVRAVGRCV
jgi:hypothetical protein